MTSEFEPTPVDAGLTDPPAEEAGAPDDTSATAGEPTVEPPSEAAPGAGGGPATANAATLSAAAAPTEVATPAEAARAGPGADDAAPLSRRRKVLLVLLTSMCAVFVVVSGWYLLNRKPITQLPLPVITVEQIPHYAFSVYGVTAPTGVAVSADGSRIYVTQTSRDPGVLIFDGSGRTLGVARPPASTGAIHVPVYVAVEPRSGDVYVSDRPTGSIYVYSADGRYRRTFDPGPSLDGWQPLGLGFDARGDLFVTDVGGPNRIHVFGADGTLVRSIGAAGALNFPNGVAVDAADNVYVTDSNNGRLVVFDPAGRQIAVIRRGPAEGDLGLPRGAAVDDAGRVYVVDTTAHAVQLYQALAPGDRSPRYIGRFGVQGTDDGAFEFPNGVAVDGRARVYVADWDNNRVQVWTF